VQIRGNVAVITGAAGGIGRALALELAKRGAKGVGLVDRTPNVATTADELNRQFGRQVALPFNGDVTETAFRKQVFDALTEQCGRVSICVPAAAVTRDDLAVRLDRTSATAQQYPEDTFREVVEINLVAPVYWALEMIARTAEERFQRNLGRWRPTEDIQGTIVLIGSVSSLGNKGQLSYAATKAGIGGAAATLRKEAIFYGVRCAVIHPGYTDTPMVRALGDEYIESNILPYTQLGRLLQPEEIADAICFLITSSAVSGQLWADGGWHPPA
jgi:NAD(P)-dependent dehydrogenase (short-subunit alcohol dehydrogenase family)